VRGKPCPTAFQHGRYASHVTDLEALRGLCDLLDEQNVARLRAAGLQSVRVGALELYFAAPSGPQSIEATDGDLSPPTERNPDPKKEADDDERAALELLFHSSGGDAEAMLEMKRRVDKRSAA
jgi:hypothetical protein